MKSSAKTGPNQESYQMVMEKTSHSEISCRYSHQTHFTSSHRRRQKTRNSKGFCEDNLPLQMSEQNSQGRGATDTAYSSDTRPSRIRQTILICLPKSMVIADPTHAPGSHKIRHTIPAKRGCCQERLHPQTLIFTLTVLSLVHCFQHLSRRCFLLGR